MFITRSHEAFKHLVNLIGWDDFLVVMNKEYPDMGFYKVSTNWLEDMNYNCRLNGEYGDLVINWKEETV